MEATVNLPGSCKVPTGRTLFNLDAVLQRGQLLRVAMSSAACTPQICFVAVGSRCTIVLSMGTHRTHHGCRSSSTLPKFAQCASETTHGKESLRGNQQYDAQRRCECTDHLKSTIS